MKKLIAMLLSVCLLITLISGCGGTTNEQSPDAEMDWSGTSGTESTAPDGTEPDGTEPDGTEPDGTESTEPDGTEPTEPDGTEPTEPDGTEPTEPEQDPVCTSHDFGEWTTTAAPTCMAEGKRTHNCRNCDASETESIAALGHNWCDATCLSAKYCLSCGATEGGLGDHTGGTATCQHGKRCDLCGTVYTEPSDHNLVDATCTSPAYCIDCGNCFGEELGHSYSGDSCIRCGKKTVKVKTSPWNGSFPISIGFDTGKITDASYEISGDTLIITVTGAKNSAYSGKCKFGWTVYGSDGYTMLAKGDYSSEELEGGETFTAIITVEGVITSSNSTYYVYFGLPHY